MSNLTFNFDLDELHQIAYICQYMPRESSRKVTPN